MSTTAGTIILAVRDLIPDPTASYGSITEDGGAFRAATLYRWLNSLVQRAARNCGAIVTDWTAIQQVDGQPWYALDDTFITIKDGFSNQYRLDRLTVSEGDVLWPGTGNAEGQSLWGYLRRTGSGLTFGLWPVPEATDPTTTLNGALTASTAAGATIALTAVASTVLSFGYFQVDSEIIQYQARDTTLNTVGVISRGVCGTTAASHLTGATVTFLGLWLKGSRRPAAITAGTSVIELPADLIDLLEDALLSRCRSSEQEFAEGGRLLREFDQNCRAVRADPDRKENMGRVPAYGDGAGVGPLYIGGRGILR